MASQALLKPGRKLETGPQRCVHKEEMELEHRLAVARERQWRLHLLPNATKPDVVSGEHKANEDAGP